VIILFLGFLLKLPIWGQPAEDQIFDDTDFWDMPEDGFPADKKQHDHQHESSVEQGNHKHIVISL